MKYILIGVLVGGAPLAVGGVHVPVVVALCAVAIAAVAVSIGAADGERVDVSLPSLGFFLLAVLAVLQSIPSPGFVRNLLDHHGEELFRQGWSVAIGGQPHVWRPLTLDPVQTADRGLRFLTTGLAAVAAANLGGRHAWRRAFWLVVGSAVVVFGVGGFLHVATPHSFFGIYEPSVGFRGLSPFVSTNHGAVYFGAASLAAVALALHAYEDRPSEAIVGAFLAVVFLLVMAVHDSDGAMLGYLVALAVFVAGVAIRSDRARSVRHRLRQIRPPSIAAFVVGLVCVVVLLSWLDVFHLFATSVHDTPIGAWYDTEAANRWELTAAAWSALKDYPVFGTGAGAVDVTIGPYVDWTIVPPSSVPVVENEPLEWMMTLGIAGTLASIALMASAFYFATRRTLRSSHGSRHLATLVLLVYTAIVVQLHFPFFALGVGLTLVVLLESSMTTSGRARRGDGAQSWYRRGHVRLPRRTATVALVVAGVLAAVFAGIYFGEQNPGAGRVDPGVAETLIRQRPTDSRVYIRLATTAAHDGDRKRALKLARHAFALNPKEPVRLYLARVLAANGKAAEATRHYTRLLGSKWITRDAIDYFVADVTDASRRVDAAAGARDHWEVIARRILRIDGRNGATDFVLGLVDAHPDDALAQRVAFDTFMRMDEYGLAELWGRHLDDRHLRDAHGRSVGAPMVGEALAAQRENGKARAFVYAALDAGDVGERLWRLALRLRPAVDDATPRDFVEVESALDRYCASPLPEARRRICWSTEGWLAEGQSDLHQAELAYQRIHHRLDDPRALAAFYLRRRKCVKLERLTHTARGAAQFGEAVERLSAKCVAP